MAASIPLLLLSVLASLSPLALATTFRDGDYIHTSRKAQFHQVGSQCSRQLLLWRC